MPSSEKQAQHGVMGVASSINAHLTSPRTQCGATSDMSQCAVGRKCLGKLCGAKIADLVADEIRLRRAERRHCGGGSSPLSVPQHSHRTRPTNRQTQRENRMASKSHQMLASTA